MRYLLAVLTTAPTTCHLDWPYARDDSGYPKIRDKRVPVIVCEWYHGPRPPGMQCCHSCGNGKLGCITPRHLRWDTRANNDLDGRPFAAGELHPKAVMTWATVDQLRDEYWNTPGHRRKTDLARKYGISIDTVYQILNGETWREHQRPT